LTTAVQEQTTFPKIVDMATLATLLGVTERHIRRLVDERRIPFLRWGKLIRFDLDEIKKWLEGARVPGRPLGIGVRGL